MISMQKKLRLRSRLRAQVKCCKRHSPGTCITEKTTNLPFAHSFFYQRFFVVVLIETLSAVLSHGVIFIHFFLILLIIFIYSIYNYIYLNPFTYFFYCLIVLLQVYWYLHGHHQYLHQNSYHNGIFQQSQKKIIELWFFLCSIAWSSLINRFIPEQTVDWNWWKNWFSLQFYFCNILLRKLSQKIPIYIVCSVVQLFLLV